MTKIAFRPHGDSAAARVIAELQKFPAGTEMSTADLAKRCGFRVESVSSLLAPAVLAGALAKRLREPGNSASGCLWKLGDGKPIQRVKQTKPANASSELASPRFNFRINADVSGHQQRLANAHHPAAKVEAIEPVITERTRFTRCPGFSHDPRVQCAPDEQPFGCGFAAAGPGRDVETGRAWA